MNRILLVEDDPGIVKSLTEFLNAEGFQVASASGQTAAIQLFDREPFDLVLLDVSLSEGNGFATCASLKSRSTVPVIFLTASGDEGSTVAGLDIGADDYIAKPFRPRELVSRIRNSLRRSGNRSLVRLGSVAVNTDKGVVTKNGAEIALSALEYNVTDVAGHDLLRAFSDFDSVTKQGLNGVAYTLLALDSRDYEIPEAEKGAKQTTRDALVDYLLEAQLADGGWAYGGETAEADMTAIVLQALAPYVAEDAKTTQEKAVAKAVERALECLSKIQTPTGGFTSGGSVTPESAAQVIVALTALGIDPQTDARFIKNGVNALDSLCSFYTEGGGFRHTMRGERDELATTQGYYALAAYWRMTQEKTPLYDMSDLDESAQKAA